ncbi:MAG: hypothetical protein LBU05_04040, partial [Bifidobacteriaceae bacterium]|jgi:hypothetical protein|nr:hypothetical protein [Bifidobacteriaceae bacterium]
LSGAKFQNDDEPSDAEFGAFRAYIISNYKKMRVKMGEMILRSESAGVRHFGGDSFSGPLGSNVYKRIEEWALANGATKQGGCYVATAVYGSYDCPQVWTLRRYRDLNLRATHRGRAFVGGYYAVSPRLVRWFAGSSWFNAVVKAVLDRMVESLRRRGYSDAPYVD